MDIEEERILKAYARRSSNEKYSLFNPAQLLILQERESSILALLKKSKFSQLHTKKILEVGCQTGYWIRDFIKWGAYPENITGVDLIPQHIAIAKKLCPAAVTLKCANAANLDFSDGSFDIVVASTLFTSILDSAMKKDVAKEMMRVLKNNGIILWYDFKFNNPWNTDVKGVKKEEIHQLFPEFEIKLQRITLLPILCRFLASKMSFVCYLLSKIPFFCTHYLGLLTKRR